MASVSLAACSAVFPELSTPVRSAPPGFQFDPPPPRDLVYFAFSRAVIPDRTRDGRAWDSVGGSLPDVFAKLVVDGTDLFVTPVQSNTLAPTWPNQKRGNYRVRPGAQVIVELWDSNPLNNHPICSKEIKDLHDQVSVERSIEITCESGAFVELMAEPAHGEIGTGLFYEIRTDGQVYVARVVGESPAARAGLRRGDQILKVMGEPVKSMDEGRVRSLINANASTGIGLMTRGTDGAEHELVVKDGPIYGEANERLR
ncbi:MAG TPA: PDZ domain-containing protein [Polyangiaceae bacterium]|nr:PDZ domain-containing protein [Polyangiaceae bacterium]